VLQLGNILTAEHRSTCYNHNLCRRCYCYSFLAWWDSPKRKKKTSCYKVIFVTAINSLMVLIFLIAIIPRCINTFVNGLTGTQIQIRTWGRSAMYLAHWRMSRIASMLVSGNAALHANSERHLMASWNESMTARKYLSKMLAINTQHDSSHITVTVGSGVALMISRFDSRSGRC